MTSELFPKYFRIFRNDIMFSGMALDTMPKQQQTMSELLVYKASAGSGKTFTLAVEYIKLLMANPRAYRQILAVTFTNKATAEMKERILSQLYGLSVDDKESQAYLNRIVEDTGMEPAAVRQAAGVALGYLLHDYSQFRVETIDSFFQSVMRNLARELELSPNLNIELNIKKVLSDAVDVMLEELDVASPTLAWLMDYIDERIKEDKRWNVSAQVKNFGTNIINEVYLERGEGLRKRLSNPKAAGDYKKMLQGLRTEVLEQMKGFADQFDAVREIHQLAEDAFKGKSRSICSYFKKLSQGKIDNDVRNATVEGCLEDAENWAAKTHPRRAEVLELAEDTFMPMLREAEELRAKNNWVLNSCQLALHNLNDLQLLADIDVMVKRLNKEANRFLLAETNALLHKLVKEGDSSFVFEKLGTRIQHVMIDEFQDTSRMQWGNFKLLLLEGLSQGADSLIVGDVKQSIYRWRSGDWGILNGLNHRIDGFDIRVKTLATNRRSETGIIRFNNSVFSAAVQHLNRVYYSELAHDCDELLQAYADVKQESPKAVERGFVQVNFLPKVEEPTGGEPALSYKERTIRALGEEVKRLLALGVKPGDIAIVVRENKHIPAIADYLDKEVECKVVSNEAYRLEASLAVSMLMNGLRYLSDAKNSIAVAELVMGYQTGVLQQEPDWNKWLVTAQPADFLPDAFVQQVASLRMMPLYELLEELFVIFKLKRIEQEDAYLFAFFDAVTEYLQSNSSEMDAFIAYWEETLCSKSIASGEVEGIQLFSIHKSKGLEFHTVLVPFCDWTMENGLHSQLVWCVPQQPPFNEMDILPINYSKAMAESAFSAEYLQERLQLWVDNLNLLYVAFTRAGKNLVVWCKEGDKGTVSELMANALPQVAEEVDGAVWDGAVYEQGVRCISEQREEQREKQPEERPSTNPLTAKPRPLPVVMESLKHEIAFRQSNKSADFIQGMSEEEQDERLINRGKLLHALFAGIETTQDVEGALEQLVRQGVIRNEEKVHPVRQMVEKALSLPQVQDWYSGTWQLFNECAIIYKENGVLQTRRPDRVMMRDGEVVVVDFKFGKEHKKYNKQVAAYVALLQRMGYEHITGYLWYVDEEKIVTV